MDEINLNTSEVKIQADLNTGQRKSMGDSILAKIKENAAKQNN
jgi:hypothetical protein